MAEETGESLDPDDTPNLPEAPLMYGLRSEVDDPQLRWSIVQGCPYHIKELPVIARQIIHERIVRNTGYQALGRQFGLSHYHVKRYIDSNLGKHYAKELREIVNKELKESVTGLQSRAVDTITKALNGELDIPDKELLKASLKLIEHGVLPAQDAKSGVGQQNIQINIDPNMLSPSKKRQHEDQRKLENGDVQVQDISEWDDEHGCWKDEIEEDE